MSGTARPWGQGSPIMVSRCCPTGWVGSVPLCLEPSEIRPPEMSPPLLHPSGYPSSWFPVTPLIMEAPALEWNPWCFRHGS